MLLELQAPFTVPNNWKKMRHFVGGGISGCPDWQEELLFLLADLNIVALNPRRSNFDPQDEDKQVEWEYAQIETADSVSLWFCKQTLNPIVILELGRMLGMKNTPLFVGMEPGYARTNNLSTQLRIGRPDVEVVHSIPDLAQNIRGWYGSLNRPNLFDTFPSARSNFRALRRIFQAA